MTDTHHTLFLGLSCHIIALPLVHTLNLYRQLATTIYTFDLLYHVQQGFPPEENPNQVLNDIHELLTQLSHQTPPFCFDVPNSNRVAHPISGMLGETLVQVL